MLSWCLSSVDSLASILEFWNLSVFSEFLLVFWELFPYLKPIIPYSFIHSFVCYMSIEWLLCTGYQSHKWIRHDSSPSYLFCWVFVLCVLWLKKINGSLVRVREEKPAEFQTLKRGLYKQREYHIWWATFRGFICFLEGDWCRYNEYNWGHGELSKHSCPIVVVSRHQGYLIQRHRCSGGWCAGGDELWEWLLTSVWIHSFPHLYGRKVKSAPVYIFKVDFLVLLIIKDKFFHQDTICVETDCCLSG